MDFDTAKENIQPLRQGRRADCLEAALGEQSKEILELEKKQHEDAIKTYEGSDPLAPWYEYICWLEQMYPKSGSESALDEVLVNCIEHFDPVGQYQQDRRLIKLYIKYIDGKKDNPNESYSMLYNNGVGTLVADLYIAWSYYSDALNNYKQVEAIFQKGIDARAQPTEELEQAHQAFRISMSRRLLYDDESSKQEFKATMEQKRSALTSLRAHKKKHVPSVRTGIAVRNENPGLVLQENVASSSNAHLKVHEDEQGASCPLPVGVSVIRSIIDSAEQKENVHEPGPWSKAKLGNLFGKHGATSQIEFAILEDENLPPIPCPEKLFEKGIQLPSDHVSRNTSQPLYIIPMVIPEPPVLGIPCYEKFLLYPNDHTEISPDEYRGYRWFKDRGLNAPLIEQYDKIWSYTFEAGIRIPPGFLKKNFEQVERVQFARHLADDDNEVILQFDKLYPENGEELSNEELLAAKFRAGAFELLTEEDFEEIDAMDLTIIGDRRQSVYHSSRLSIVPRKSVMMRKSVLPPPVVEEEEEEEAEEEVQQIPEIPLVKEPEMHISTGAIRKTIFKRKFEDHADDDARPAKQEFVFDTPPRASFPSVFKPPMPFEKKQVVFAMEEDDPNDSCSTTQQFNLFIKSQSVSTPVSKKKTAPYFFPPPQEAALRLSDLMSPQNESAANNPNSESVPTERPSQAADAVPKGLSTIMETTETTQSTKSSVSHVSAENETAWNLKTPKDKRSSPAVPKFDAENLINNSLLSSFHVQDQDKTIDGNDFMSTDSRIKPMPPMKPREIATSFVIFEDESFSVPEESPYLEQSVKSPVSENSGKSSQSQVTQIENPEREPEESQLVDNIKPADQHDMKENENYEIPETEQIYSPDAIQEIKEKTFEVAIPVTEHVSQFVVRPMKPDSFLIPRIPTVKMPELEQSLARFSFAYPAHDDYPATQEPSLKVGHFTQDESIMDIPATQDESIMDIPATQDESTMNIPATQDESTMNIPATQDHSAMTVPRAQREASIFTTQTEDSSEEDKNENVEHATQGEPATQASFIDILATQASFIDITATQASFIDIPETKEPPEAIDFPATQEPESSQGVQPARNLSIPFSIYEDSVIAPPKATEKFADDEAAGFLHVSRKENLAAPPPPGLITRSVSDEFLHELMLSPMIKKSKEGFNHTQPSKAGHAVDVSDMLKFSSTSHTSRPEASLGADFQKLSIDAKRSATPTYAFDEDLNTEKFSLALGNAKNSTLLSDIYAWPQTAAEKVPEKVFDVSVIFEEDELLRLGFSSHDLQDKPQAPAAEFKVPPVPAIKPISAPKPTNDIKRFEASEDDEEDDMSKSIYKPQQTFVQELDDESESWEAMCSFVATADNKYEHTIVEEHNISLRVQQAILDSEGDPFSSRLREVMLDHCSFSQYLEAHVSTACLLKKIPQLRPGLSIECGGEEFKILKYITKGSFGAIFTGQSNETGKVHALKQEKPASLWEYYVCVELKDRLKDKRMLPAFMKVDFAIIANNSSVLISDFSPYGTILDVCNKIKTATNRNIEEYVVMVLTTQLLSIIDHLHGCKIIHADIKPDNFLVMSKIEYGVKTPALQLIDFGSAIDMDWYEDNDTFTKQVITEHFVCCEMLEKKPWTYQTDLFGIAGTSHVMLFGKYMEVDKKLLTWNITARFARYHNKTLWESYFSALLNVPDCFTMPNLQALKDQFEEFIQSREKFVCDKIYEFNKVLDRK